MAARDRQVDGYSAIELAVTHLEKCRKAAAIKMFRIYGLLVAKFAENPIELANYMPVHLLQVKKQSFFKGHTPSDKASHVFKRKLEIGKDIISITNLSKEPIKVYFSNGLVANATIPEMEVVIAPQDTRDIFPEVAGYTDENCHCYVLNTSDSEVEWEIELF